MNKKLNAAAGKILEALKLIESVNQPEIQKALADIKTALPELTIEILREGVNEGKKIALNK